MRTIAHAPKQSPPFLAVLAVQTRGHWAWVDSDVDWKNSRSPPAWSSKGPLLLSKRGFVLLLNIMKWDESQPGMGVYIHNLCTQTDRGGSGDRANLSYIILQIKQEKKRSFSLCWLFHLGCGTLIRVYRLHLKLHFIYLFYVCMNAYGCVCVHLNMYVQRSESDIWESVFCLFYCFLFCFVLPRGFQESRPGP